jgi:hypothetical protein
VSETALSSTALDLIRARERLVHERLLAVVEDLSDEQIAWRPAPKAHSIGFALWHCARADDNVQADLTGHAPIWELDAYAGRWGHPESGVGTGWDDERAASLPLPAKSELAAYARRVFEAIDGAAAAMDERRLVERVRSRFAQGHDAMLGDVLIRSLDHDNRHLGEMEYIKGLLGLRGTATV